MLKFIIVVLLIGNLIVLGISFFTMTKDQGTGTKRTVYWLTLRVSLAALLMLVVTYGVWSGDLAISSPWHHPQR